MKWIDRPTGEQPLLKKDNALKTYPLGGVEKVYSPPQNLNLKRWAEGGGRSKMAPTHI